MTTLRSDFSEKFEAAVDAVDVVRDVLCDDHAVIVWRFAYAPHELRDLFDRPLAWLGLLAPGTEPPPWMAAWPGYARVQLPCGTWVVVGE